MPWLKMKLHTNSDQARVLADAFEEWGAISVTLQDAGDEPVYDTYWEQPPLWSQVKLIGLFPEHTDTEDILSRVRERLSLAETPAHEIDLLGDEDWAHSWMAHYKPLQVGHDLWVVPSWCTPPEPNAVNIMLDPGLAFGTGEHPTTCLCLEWFAEQNLAGKTLLDYGCGSGILSIAALKLGIAQAYAVDIDARALDVTRQNALHNAINVGLTVTIPADLPDGFQADIVVANILSGTLMELAPKLIAHVPPGGWLILSGMLAGQEIDVRARFEPPFHFETRERQKWVALAGRKPTGLG